MAVMARKGLQDRPEALAALQKTTLAVLRRLAGKGAVRVVATADAMRAWERAWALTHSAVAARSL